MKKLIMFIFLLFNFQAWAHHTKDHTMLMENTDQVINMTKQGADDPWLLIVWSCIVILFTLGVVKLINKK